jgi:hypothetical protein
MSEAPQHTPPEQQPPPEHPRWAAYFCLRSGVSEERCDRLQETLSIRCCTKHEHVDETKTKPAQRKGAW